MLNPPLNQLTSQIKSKYLIATTAAKRAREIDEQPETELLSEYHSFKPVGRALEEIADVKFALLFQVIIMVKNSFDH
ncbi:TPA: DNA-directed RNA polymerase subunit omega [Staphylococcus aureus]|nr:DNA-directed RNA polymerase subunit omega [Staphylococcus aureus]HDB6848488.1 DNA-directed RNA polymerase subunit omega [Staphylococcus aureus]